MKNIIFSVFIVLLFVSCKRDAINAKTEGANVGIINAIAKRIAAYEKPHDAEVFIMNQGTPGNKYAEAVDYFSVSGAMFKNKNPLKRGNYGVLMINGHEIPFIPGSDNGGGYGINDASGPRAHFLRELWGKKNKIGFIPHQFIAQRPADEGNEFYMPQQIDMSSDCLDSKLVHRSEGLLINWVQDENNPSQKVYLFAVYEGPDSFFANPDFSSSTEVVFDLELTDDGEVFIASDVLGASFRIGSRISFYLVRDNFQTVTDSYGNEVLMHALTWSYSGVLAAIE